LWIPAAASLAIGCFGAIHQQSLKRFMAYASINQVGFLLSGLCSMPSAQGLNATMNYLLVYMLTNLVFFGFIMSTAS